MTPRATTATGPERAHDAEAANHSSEPTSRATPRVPAPRANGETNRTTVCHRPAPTDVTAIQSSLAAVQRRPVQLAETFYVHLFEMAPAARAMFPPDLSAQMQKMTATLLTVITTLSSAYAAEHDEQVNALERSLQLLGAAHHDHWQVKPEHYHYIPHALTRAVRDVAGPAWSGTVSSSWIALVQWINSHMLFGADQPPTDAPVALLPRTL